MIIAMTGSTGLLGSRFKAMAESFGHTVLPIKRVGSPASPHWNITEVALRRPEAVVHLAGENVSARRWNATQKERIRDSRVVGTERLCQKIAQLETRPRVFVSASAIGYYGDRGDEILEESATPGDGFLAEVCVAWETASTSLLGIGTRVINLRFGMVLDSERGAMARMLPIFTRGWGGPLGDGQQWVSWVDSNDAARSILFCLEQQGLDGAVNVVSPNPIQNNELTKELAAAVGRSPFFRVPKLAVVLGFGQMGEELLLASSRVAPARLTGLGFEFEYPQISASLERIIRERTPAPG
jgi:uncharacterized protein (TIGR01777 family)